MWLPNVDATYRSSRDAGGRFKEPHRPMDRSAASDIHALAARTQRVLGADISHLRWEGLSYMSTQAAPARGSIGELTVYFLRLGLLGFGGPVALVGQMERELVAERAWLSNEQMREAIAICQSLPGPLAIQVGIYISYLRGGFWGAWAGGWAFILPNFVIVAALGALYVFLGDLQPVTAIFYGVSPAVIALILHSCYRLAKLGMDDWLQWALAAVAFAVTLALRAEVAWIFLAAGAVGILYYGSLFRA